jgi:hypothetical protein
MNGTKKKMGTGLVRRVAFFGRLFRGTLTTVAIASLAFAATSARAACGSFGGIGSGGALTLPMLQAESGALGASTSSSPSIVGLWGVIYSSGGMVFNQTFDQWHSDGTEFENAFVPVLGGNICFGVWKSTGGRAVKLHHIGWTYDPVAGGVANGTFTLDENNTVSKDGNSYTGSFTFRAFDMKGNVQKTVSGTIAAVRITVE